MSQNPMSTPSLVVVNRMLGRVMLTERRLPGIPIATPWSDGQNQACSTIFRIKETTWS